MSGAAQSGTLLATMLNVLVTSMTDQSRSQRGRAYARQGAVVDLVVHPGVLTASVQGSRPGAYRVVVHTAAAESFETRGDIVPERHEVRFACTCPDDAFVCKHGVAVMAEFAERVIDEPELLGLWRGQPQPGSGPRAVVGSRSAGATGTAGRTARSTEPAFSVEVLAGLRAFLGDPAVVDLEIEHVSAIGPPVAAYGDLWAEMLADALQVLALEIVRPPS